MAEENADLKQANENMHKLLSEFKNTKYEKMCDDNETIEYILIMIEELCKSQVTYEDLVDPCFVPNVGLINKDEMDKVKNKLPECSSCGNSYFQSLGLESCFKITVIDDLIRLKKDINDKKSVQKTVSKKDTHIDNLNSQVKKLQLQLSEKEQAYTLIKKNLKSAKKEIKSKESTSEREIRFQSERDELQKKAEDLELKLEKSSEQHSVFQAKIKQLNEFINDKLMKIESIQNSNKRLENLNDTLSAKLKELERTNVNFYVADRDLLEDTLCKLKEELECPILMIPIDTPVVTPSGRTVDIKAMEELIKKNAVDPYDSEKNCKNIVNNLLAVKLKEIISEAEIRLQKIIEVEPKPNINKVNFDNAIVQTVQQINNDVVNESKLSYSDLSDKYEAALKDLQSLQDENDLLTAAVKGTREEYLDKITNAEEQHEKKERKLLKAHKSEISQLQAEISELKSNQQTNNAELKGYLARIYELENDLIKLRSASLIKKTSTPAPGISDKLRLMIKCWLFVCMKLSKAIYQLL